MLTCKITTNNKQKIKRSAFKYPTGEAGNSFKKDREIWAIQSFIRKKANLSLKKKRFVITQ